MKQVTQTQILSRELKLIRDSVETEQHRLARIEQAAKKLANAIQILAKPEVSRTLKA